MVSRKILTAEMFDFQQEIKKYCRSDVDTCILRRAFLQFRQLLLDATAIDPFSYVTIASVCMGVYKSLFLEEHYQAILLTAKLRETGWVPLRLSYTRDTKCIHLDLYNFWFIGLVELHDRPRCMDLCTLFITNS